MLYVKYNGKHKLLSPRCCCCFGTTLDNNDLHNGWNFSNTSFELSSLALFRFISLIRERERKGKFKKNQLNDYTFSLITWRKTKNKEIQFRLEKLLIRINYIRDP